jgi:uncharacterized protein YlxW (UPF0749 family)
MSNSKKTVKGEYSNMYGNGKNLNIGKNKSTNELLNNIKNSNLNKELNLNTNTNTLTEKINQYDLEKDKDKNSFRESLSIPKSISSISSVSVSPFNMLYVFLILFILFIIGLLIYYKDMVIDFFNNIFNDTPKDTSAKVDNTSAKVDDASAKVDNASAKVDLTTAKVESTSAKIDILDKKVDTLISSKSCGPSNINTLNDKINDISPYKEAKVTADGFCYIGYDNGQRECVDVYAGDVCMSGEIFPSLDICINPKMRN